MRLKPEGLDLPQQIFIRFELGVPNFNFSLVDTESKSSDPLGLGRACTTRKSCG